MKPSKDLRLEALKTEPESFRSGSPENLLMDECGRLRMYYAPFEHVNVDARVVLVGLTPGRVQAANALAALQDTFSATMSWDEALRMAKEKASFSGPMRANLIRMLDHIGLHEILGLNSCSELFGPAKHLVHHTSILRYPILINSQNYSGSPSPETNPWLRSIVEQNFSAEIRSIRAQPLIVPLGPKVNTTVQTAAAAGLIFPEAILSGMPHPSGANAERIAYFLGKKKREDLSSQTNARNIEISREGLLKKLTAIRKASGFHSEV